MRKAVVSVGTHHYTQGMNRLQKMVHDLDPTIQFHGWNVLPLNWPTHENKPYAFKSYALMHAAQNADLLLWCDAAVIPIRSMEPLWEKIERDGYCFGINGWTNYEWTADSAYEDLFPGVPIEEARAINRTFPQVWATAFGLNVRSEIGKKFLDEYFRLANTNAFRGPWTNTNSKEVAQWNQDSSRMAPCGPPDVLGHRHDQTAASLIAFRLGMQLTQCPLYFGYGDDPGTILKAVGA